jgi:hypothetical protein
LPDKSTRHFVGALHCTFTLLPPALEPRSREDLRGALGEEQLSKFHDDFVAALASSVAESSEYDDAKKAMLSICTVLHVSATAV